MLWVALCKPRYCSCCQRQDDVSVRLEIVGREEYECPECGCIFTTDHGLLAQGPACEVSLWKN